MSSRLPYAVIVLSAVLMVPLFSLSGLAATSSTPIAIQTVGVQGNVSDCHIAVDRLGSVHICYFNEDDGSLMYATNAGGSWATQTVAGPGLAGPACSIAVDSHGNAHVAYVGRYQNESPDLMYATNAGGSWDNQIIDPGYVGGYTSIAVDGQDNVHISYHIGHDASNDDLMYATDSSGTWRTAIVDTGISGYYNAIALSKDGSVYICSYAGIGGMPLKCSTNAGGAWSTQNIEDSVQIGSYSSIAVDSQGRPHIALSTSSTFSQVNLKHAVYTGGSWSSEVVEAGGYVRDSSIGIDGLDVVHLCYRASASNQLMYATNANGSWSTQAVDSINPASYFASMAVEANGNAHLCYVSSDSTGDHLKYAKIGDAVTPAGSTAPANPTNLTATVAGGSIELSWNAPSDDGGSAITGYTIYRGNDSGSMVSIATVNGTSYMDSGVADGETLYYKVVAVNGNGVSAPTNTVTATVGSGPSSSIDGGNVVPSGTIGVLAIVGIVSLVAAAAVTAFLLTRGKRRA